MHRREVRDYVAKALGDARRRCSKSGLRFGLVPSDISIPTHCPILGIELCFTNNSQKDNSPSLDRKNNRDGYVPGNVHIISHLANTMKGSSSSTDRVNFAIWVLKTHPKNVNRKLTELKEALKLYQLGDTNEKESPEVSIAELNTESPSAMSVICGG